MGDMISQIFSYKNSMSLIKINLKRILKNAYGIT